MDPIHQFEIKNLFTLFTVGNTSIAFTNSALYMVIALAVIALLMLGATGSRALIPGRLQSVAESIYEFIEGMTKEESAPILQYLFRHQVRRMTFWLRAVSR